MLHIIEGFEKWVHTHSDGITIFTGSMAGALWKSNLLQIAKDICTLQNIEDIITVAIKAFIGALVAWGFKSTCNYYTKKSKRKLKSNLKE